MSRFPFDAPFLPICSRNLPSFENFRHGVAAVPGEPHVVFPVNRDAVHRRRPFVAGARRTPVTHEVTFRIEFQNRRRRRAAELRDRLRHVARSVPGDGVTGTRRSKPAGRQRRRLERHRRAALEA